MSSYLERPEEMLDLKLLVGPGSLLGQDPDVEALGPELYKAYAVRHDVPLILGVGAGFLAGARPEAVAERVRRYVEVGARGGRFALYLCNLGRAHRRRISARRWRRRTPSPWPDPTVERRLDSRQRTADTGREPDFQTAFALGEVWARPRSTSRPAALL